MMVKSWRTMSPPPAGFADTLGIDAFRAHLLFNREIREAHLVEPFLTADSRLLNDPMLLPDMDRAVARLKRALERDEPIGIFGDFDTDGITGTALLALALRDLGARVVPHLPDRVDEGHGLNDGALLMLKEGGVSLLITVDCGVTSVDEVETAAGLGMDTIITDHHSILPDMPGAYAIVNPRRADSAYPYHHLTGVGMAFKLVEALYDELGQPWPEHLLELVALGTVADVGPLTGENRFLVKRGLEQLNRTTNPGILALVEKARMKLGSLDTESLSFGIIPRLNVAGRLDHPMLSLELLTAPSLEAAKPIADLLERKNAERQRLTDQGVHEAVEQVEARRASGGLPSILVVASERWVPGILGLIAARLADYYYRPAVAVGLGEEMGRASARSIPEFDMIAALRECGGEMFIRFGGHPEAAGFSIDVGSMLEFQRRIEGIAEARLGGLELHPSIDIDCEVSPAMFTLETCGFIQTLSPFGQGNPAPVFLTRNARVVEARQVGNGSRHLKMKVHHNGVTTDAIAFRQGGKLELASRGSIDLVYSVGLDTWWGDPRVQLTVMDFRRSG